jgi:peptide methionine sulfoxide reductase MsrA
MWMAKLQAALMLVVNHRSHVRHGNLQQHASEVIMPSPEPTTVYFGSGCFWERQYAYAWEVELGGNLAGASSIFNRNIDTVTSVSGYAGSKKVGPKGLVCYHNTLGEADYGSLGMGEGVQVSLDPGKEVTQFQTLIKNFFSAYTNGRRPDPGDQGGEYRSFIGLPGGIKGELFKYVLEANNALAADDRLVLKEGHGEEDDVTGTAWVYDSKLFPFHRAEQYHQFHSNFAPPSYGLAYLQQLRKRQIALGKISSTGCPEGKHW